MRRKLFLKKKKKNPHNVALGPRNLTRKYLSESSDGFKAKTAGVASFTGANFLKQQTQKNTNQINKNNN